MMRNLKKETLEILDAHGKTADDILWVGCEDFCISVELFWKLADKKYDEGFGGQQVATDLMVVGDGWWLERHDYDGAEWWEYKETPKKPSTERDVARIISPSVGGWSLNELNDEEHEYLWEDG